ncbi:MAG: putative iron-sulfur cluster-binding metallochaperone [Anaerolineaceae bacterium]
MEESFHVHSLLQNEDAQTVAQSNQYQVQADVVCPDCGQKGKPVHGQTIKALLSVSLNRIREADYYFCRSTACSVVYFTADGNSKFTTGQIRERVYQKEPNQGDVFVCYCFKHTIADILNATPEEFNALLHDINSGINANHCACDLRNPQGSCCLGNVRSLRKQAR